MCKKGGQVDIIEGEVSKAVEGMMIIITILVIIGTIEKNCEIMIPFEGGEDGKVILPVQVRLAPLKVCHRDPLQVGQQPGKCDYLQFLIVMKN